MRTKIYITAGIFIALTALKFLPGNTAENIREGVRQAVEMDTDYSAAMEGIGRELNSLGIVNEVKQVLHINSGQVRPAEVSGIDPLETINAEQIQTSPELLILNLDLNALRGNDTERQEAVRAFLDEQAEYAGYDIPDNVITDMPKLPFDYMCPVDGRDSSGFGYRLHPIHNEIKFHFGTDFAANSGETVKAFADGKVRMACYSDSFGNYVVIDHIGGISSLYAHLSSFGVAAGDDVCMGQNIAKVGQSGKATGPHLHFEIHMDGMYINPEYYI